MTVGELIVVLQRLRSEATVVVTWEGQRVRIAPDSVYVSAGGEVVIDADGNGYRSDIMRKPGFWSEES